MLVEVDDMFGHEPLAQSTRALLEGYVQQSLLHGRYDFRMGRRLHQALEAAGLQVEASFELPDRELAFAGPADPDVLAAWRARLRRMALLQAFCAERFADVERDLLQCLGSPEHRSTARVIACIARRP